MKHNLKQFEGAYTIISKGAAKHSGSMTILSNYPPGHIGFGNRVGRYSLKVEVESFTSILSTYSADMAKVDCEGYEKYLLDVENASLRRIPYWIIEMHDTTIAQSLRRKFLEAGFEMIPNAVLKGHLEISHFSLTN